jgi:hypothetical protein
VTGEYPGPSRRRTAEIVFMARVTAGELRFLTAPDEAVEFTGETGDESASGSVRTNLPDEVAVNTTYRDIQVDYAIAAKLADEPPD